MAEKSAYKSLQNGSDIRGIAVDGVVGEKVNLTPERVVQIGGALPLFCKSERKNRPETYELQSAPIPVFRHKT